MGAREKGVRVSALVEDKPGQLEGFQSDYRSRRQFHCFWYVLWSRYHYKTTHLKWLE